MLKAALAFLPDPDARARLLAWFEVCVSANRGRLRLSGLPPHISLKQPFAIEDRDGVISHHVDLARRLEPLTARLGAPEVVGSVHWLPVENDEPFRRVHDQLNAELLSVVADPTADFDGPSYRSHMTIGFFEGDGGALTAVADPPVAEVQLVDLGLFLYEESAAGEWRFHLHSAVALGQGGG